MWAAVCVTCETWKSAIDGCKCISFIDNQGDLDALIKGYNSENTMKSLLVLLERLDARKPCLPWFCRVPSESNISDLPSCGKWKELFTLLPERKAVDVVCPFDSRKLQTIFESDSMAEANGDEADENFPRRCKKSRR